jgi:phosphoglycerate dehydrogenase-like enzyme
MKTLLVWTGDDDTALCAALAGLSGVTLRRAESAAEAAAAMSTADGMVTSVIPWDAALAASLRAAPRLGWIQVLNAGYDNLEALGLPANLRLSTLGALGSGAIAEHALTLLLGVLRALPQSQAAAREFRWDTGGLRSAIAPLSGSTIAIVGYGPIGQAVARLVQAFGATPVAVAQRERTEDGVVVRPYGALHAVLATADAVVVCAPLKAQTTRLIDAAAFAAMRPGARLVNISRGAVVDTSALCAALDSGRLAGAGLDVTDPEPLPPGHPLWRHPRVLLTPHVAWVGRRPAEQQQRTEFVVANVARFAAGETPQGIVSFTSRAPESDTTCASPR